MWNCWGIRFEQEVGDGLGEGGGREGERGGGLGEGGGREGDGDGCKEE